MAKLICGVIFGKAKFGNDWLEKLSIGPPWKVIWGTSLKVRNLMPQGASLLVVFSDWKFWGNFHWDTVLRYFTEPQTHRMTVFGRDLWTSGPPLDQHPCSKQGQEDQVAQSQMGQMPSEFLQGWRLHSHARQPVPAFDHPQRKKALFYL